MTAEALLALAERCEREEPSRELDVAIAQGVWPQLTQYQTYCVGDEEPLFFADPFYKQPCPHFTTSLDAAVTLVPEDASWEVAGSEHTTSAAVHHPETDAGLGQAAGAWTPALALCAAALRARAALLEPQTATLSEKGV